MSADDQSSNSLLTEWAALSGLRQRLLVETARARSGDDPPTRERLEQAATPYVDGDPDHTSIYRGLDALADAELIHVAGEHRGRTYHLTDRGARLLRTITADLAQAATEGSLLDSATLYRTTRPTQSPYHDDRHKLNADD